MDPSVTSPIGHTLVDKSLLILYVWWAPRAPPAPPLTLWVLMVPGLSCGGKKRGHLENRAYNLVISCCLRYLQLGMPKSRWVIENMTHWITGKLFFAFLQVLCPRIQTLTGKPEQNKIVINICCIILPSDQLCADPLCLHQTAQRHSSSWRGCIPDMLSCVLSQRQKACLLPQETHRAM